MENKRWSKYRVLITNKCNYKCLFCHNEGQDKSFNEFMSLTDFKVLVDFLVTENIEELNISGGEPFMNGHVIDMIEYADAHLKCDLSCATNLSLLNQHQVNRLAMTRVKLNIQFPYIDYELFKKSTINGNLHRIMNNIKLCKEGNINIGLNTVVQNREPRIYEDIVLHAIENEIPLKLLPQIGSDESCNCKDYIFPILSKYSVSCEDKKSGAIKWRLEKDGHKTTILYIDSPCFYKDIVTCRNFAELRIHSNLEAQPCILNSKAIKLNFDEGYPFVKKQLQDLWNNFTTC